MNDQPNNQFGSFLASINSNLNNAFNGNGSSSQSLKDRNGSSKRPLKDRYRADSLTVNSRFYEPQPLKAVAPMIDTYCFSITIDQYRVYAAQQNTMFREVNQEIRTENKKIDQLIKNKQLSELQITFSELFYKKNKQLNPDEFNQLADEFNADRGLTIRKRTYGLFTPAKEKSFEQMVFDYMNDLREYSNEYLKCGITTETTIKKMKFNTDSIYNLTRNGEKAIDVCKKTLRNHRDFFLQRGVFMLYEHKGFTEDRKQKIKRYRPSELHINPKILCVIDVKTGKLVTSENQLFTTKKEKEFTNREEDTRTYKEHNKKRKSGQAVLLDKERLTATPSICFLQEHPIVNKKENQTGAAENVKVLEKNIKISSENIEATIENTTELCRKLSAGDYNYYKPIEISYLHREAMYGTISREEFKEVIIQDFLKTAAKYYKNHSVFVGSWKNALNHLMKELFNYSNGYGKFTANKQLMVDKLAQYRWSLKNSQSFFRKSGIKRLFPSDYFDLNRTNKKEIGFFVYSETAWKRHIEYLEKTERGEKLSKKKAKLRLENINFSKNFETQYRKFQKDGNFDKIYDYIKAYLPHQFMDELHKRTAYEALEKQIQKGKYTA